MGMLNLGEKNGTDGGVQHEHEHTTCIATNWICMCVFDCKLKVYTWAFVSQKQNDQIYFQMYKLGFEWKSGRGIGGEGGHMCKRGGNLAKKRKEGLFEAVFEAGW